MLTRFFYTLKANKVPVTVTEWLTFMEALTKGLAWANTYTLYTLARSLLVKDIAHYDTFDQVFLHFFKDVELSKELEKEIDRWLDNPLDFPNLSEEEKKALEAWDFDKLKQEFEKRLLEQNERHDGGNRWVGTGGTSPFGHSGYNPSGIRVGGEGNLRQAVQVATARRFKNYRQDMVLDVRQMKMALKKLRALERVGKSEELDVEESISQTCKNAGELELVYRPERKNRMRLLLLMDAGGSMTSYARLVSRLFSAASQVNHFQRFEHFYYHNCIYEHVFSNIYFEERIPTAKIFSDFDADWRVILVGDASMSPYELLSQYGAIYYYHRNEIPGIQWLKRVSDHFRRIVWLNPIPQEHWWAQSIDIVKGVFPMFPLTIKGLEDAVAELKR